MPMSVQEFCIEYICGSFQNKYKINFLQVRDKESRMTHSKNSPKSFLGSENKLKSVKIIYF